jgi:two-component system, OmpR family, sensor kinase
MAIKIKQKLRSFWSFNLFKKPQSLRARLVLWNISTLLLTLIVLSCIVYALVTYALQSSLDQRLEIQGEKLQLATTIWLSAGHPITNDFFNQLVQNVQQDEFTSDPLYIKIFDATTGKPLQRSPNLLQERIQYNPSDFEAALHGKKTFNTYQNSNGNQVRILTLPLQGPTHQIIAVAQVGRSLASIQQVQLILVLVLGIGEVCAVLVVYLVSFWLTGRELRPLQQLSITMKNLSMQGLGVHISSTNQTTETKLLVEAFNQMSERLETGFTLQRNFVADVSHELRTPLTSLRGQIEVLLMDAELSEGVGQDLRQIQAQLVHLSRIVSNLLAMARAEIGVLPQVTGESIQRVELDLLLIEVARQAHFLKQNISLEFGDLEQIWTLGDADLLKQLLLNIIENALTYTAPGGTIWLEVVCTSTVPALLKEKSKEGYNEWARISIRDNGPGIAPADLPHIFDRHYRSSQARARSKLGSGLGLAIARLIAHAHGGEITVESELTKGSCFFVWLPNCQEIMALTP